MQLKVSSDPIFGYLLPIGILSTVHGFVLPTIEAKICELGREVP